MSQKPLAENVIPCKLSRSGSDYIAYSRNSPEQKGLPEVVFLSGLRSDMLGTKATFLAEYCEDQGQAFTRFDYFGHGLSSGEFTEGTIGLWLEDTLEIIDCITEGPLILVGSSLGGWLMCLAALKRPDRIKGMIGIAAAPDFTEELMWSSFSPLQQQNLSSHGLIHLPNDYGEGDTTITLQLIEEGREHILLSHPIPIQSPVHLLHGTEDRDVPWAISQQLLNQLDSPDAKLTLLKGGDHRLSTPSNLDTLKEAVESMTQKTKNVD